MQPKSKTTALILSVLVGALGVDRFYLGYTGLGVLKLLTGGCFGVLYILDIINIATGKLTPADGSAYEDDLNAKPAAQGNRNAYEDLEKAKNLFDQGVISEDEFNRIKSDLISKL